MKKPLIYMTMGQWAVEWNEPLNNEIVMAMIWATERNRTSAYIYSILR
jgi:hypothetical protein